MGGGAISPLYRKFKLKGQNMTYQIDSSDLNNINGSFWKWKLVDSGDIIPAIYLKLLKDWISLGKKLSGCVHMK